ncbi:fungal-specific transcription factor domain-containing protein [Bombardia bombarda]|uniref:Fungal-specific transcription factor domain-containing protein n=1 Tax=Bombardia bombarda TaxID=252184 RepID=A0AA39TWR7_9PEZI|nr:fungal-specific transcription factor domain-containing protein [Bombardia bombarda]
MPSKRKAAKADSPSDTVSVPSPVPPAAITALAPVKRQRVSRACDQCRAAREKCDGKQALCAPCLSQNRPCAYSASPKKRGVQTGYIRTLELALAWLFEKVPGCEEALDVVLFQQGSQGQDVLTGKDPRGTERLHKRWRRSRVHRGIDRILSGDNGLSPFPDKRFPSEEASDIEGDASRAGSSLPAGPQSSDTGQGQLSSAPDRGTLRSSSIPPEPGPSWQTPLPAIESHQTIHTHDIGAPSSTSPRRLKLPANHWRLLDIYFSYTHSWLPILDKQALFQASYLYSDQGLLIVPEDSSSAVHAELWSALALASFQDAASSKSLSAHSIYRDNLSPSQVYEIARRLIPPETGPFQVHHSRALLLLSLVNLGRGHMTSAWLLIGLAIRIFLDISANQPVGHSRQQQRMQSVLVACFMLDTIVSVRYDKPAHLKAEDIVNELPIPEDGLDQWEPWAPCEGFGISTAASQVSRNPAYCLSTFNQLYGILKLVARRTSARIGIAPVEERAMPLASQIQQLIDLNSPFGTFATSHDTGSASVPTAYLIRTVYLWAAALVDPQTDPYLSLMRETLYQYQKRFGICGMPPFISSCLISLTNQPNRATLSGHHKERLEELISAYSSPWGEEGRNRDLLADSSTSHQTSHLTPPATSNIPYLTMAPPPLYNHPSFPTQPSQASSSERGYRAFNNLRFPGAIDMYHQRSVAFPRSTSSATLLHHRNMRNVVDMQQSSNIIPGIDLSRQNFAVPYAGFNGSRWVDYDALLDDFASTECTDPVDVDPKFMANLGFAPGCDSSEILSCGFGET